MVSISPLPDTARAVASRAGLWMLGRSMMLAIPWLFNTAEKHIDCSGTPNQNILSVTSYRMRVKKITCVVKKLHWFSITKLDAFFYLLKN